ncbi:MAG TPA: zf-HC2 domain-containing protein [Planctomycetota bacterium]|nr:zf-HC2 domain-containing protein [Planctomycetota bacterium]
MTCEEARPLLGEYHDRELAPERADAVRTHLASCEGCAAELKALEGLDRTLRSAPARGEDVRWDRYVERIRERTGAGRRNPWKALVPLAAAAALAVVFASTFSAPGRAPAPLLDRYEAADPAERERLERSVATLGRESLAPLALAMVADADPARRRYAARLLAPRLHDETVRQLILDRSREQERRDDDEPVLIDIGFEPGDEELVAPALEMARSQAHFADAVRILRRLDRGTFNRTAHSVIVRRLRELLSSDLPRDRELAVRLAGALEILIEDVVEFLDVPDLGARVLEFLKRRTGKDFGADKNAWRAYFARRSGT